MNGQVVMDCIDAVHVVIEKHKAEIMELDQAIGDGDHVLNLLRGLEALQTIRNSIETEDAPTALKNAAVRLLATIGGSSGPLLSSLVLGMGKSMETLNEGAGPRGYATVYSDGVAALQRRGKTGKGSKTMMDVLIPVVDKFNEMAKNDETTAAILQELPEEAERGMLSTRDMLATIGRASFLGERSRGHIDPGARSCQLIIAAVCEQITKSIQEAKRHEKVSQ